MADPKKRAGLPQHTLKFVIMQQSSDGTFIRWRDISFTNSH
ncbi:hypothetical protein PG5_40370 [Pseudomonas sp. G5(2012)]|nr:hypothetical protein PG5_40370 [Pseudomonas sp. G5(2012)]